MESKNPAGVALMKTGEGADGRSETDTYATRVPTPESLEAMALASEAAGRGGGRARGVGREEFERGLFECGFLDEEGLRSAEAEASIDGQATVPDVEGLARTLVRLGKLTRYQASALFQGKGRALLIGPYVVLGKLGSGGMGMVFKARLRRGGPEVALKLLPPSASKDARAVQRFRREAAILERLDHPNVVSSHDIGTSRGAHYLVMDYVEGRDLDKLIRAVGPMKLTKAVDCIIQAARGLAAAHERGIVHRDIKPANLMIDLGGTVRVLDLGLARVTLADDTIEGGESRPSLTASGIIMGTVDFLPPEQSDDSKRVDHRADIYSLGCTLHYLLTGKPPFSGDTLMQRLVAHHQKPIPSLSEARPEVPAELDAIFRGMMAKAPEDRPRTMVEVLGKLETWRASTIGSKSLRVFDDLGDAKSASPAPKKGRKASSSPPVDPKPPRDSDQYDLLTCFRHELFESRLDSDVDGDQTLVGLTPLSNRKPNKPGDFQRRVDAVLRVLVAAAAVVVLIHFFPKIPPGSPPVAPSKPSPAPAVVGVPRPEPAPGPIAAPAPLPVSGARAVESSPTEPPFRLLMDRLLGPPPGEGPPPDRPGLPGPADRRRPPPRPGDRPPPRRPPGFPEGRSGP